MTADQITAEVAAKYGITPRVLRSGSRSVILIEPRNELARRLRIERGMSYGLIGKWIGRSPHTVGDWFSPHRRIRNLERIRTYRRAQLAAEQEARA